MTSHKVPLRVALIGCGSIGTVVAEAIRDRQAGPARLVAIAHRSASSHADALSLSCGCALVRDVSKLADYDPAIIVEAASREVVRQFLTSFLERGTDVMVMSTGALLDDALRTKAREAAERSGATVHVSSGGIGGLDVVKAVSSDPKCQVALVTRKPIAVMRDVARQLDPPVNLDGIEAPTQLYEGPAVEAVQWFPENLNVAAALALAGVGGHRTTVRVIADPTVQRTVHEITVAGDAGHFLFQIQNVPNPTNPKSSFLAALSAVAKLRSVTNMLSVGT